MKQEVKTQLSKLAKTAKQTIVNAPQWAERKIEHFVEVTICSRIPPYPDIPKAREASSPSPTTPLTRS